MRQRVMARRVVAVVTCTLAAGSLASCGQNTEELTAQATCDQAGIVSAEDSRRIVKLLPDGSGSLSSRFRDSGTAVEETSCVFDADGRRVLEMKSWFHTGDVGEAVGGATGEITGSGVTGRSKPGFALLAAPCSRTERGGDSDMFRDRHMVSRVQAEDAPDARSRQQRQRAADLALSLLRHAVRVCDSPPELPKAVQASP